MYLLSIFPPELNCFLLWSEYIWFSLLCFCPSFVSWVLPRLKFPNIHPFSTSKGQGVFNFITTHAGPYCLSHGQSSPGDPLLNACGLPHGQWGAAGMDTEVSYWRGSLGSSLHLNHSRKAAFRSPAKRGKVSCIFAWGRRMTPQMMPIIGRSQNFPVVKSGDHQSNSVTKFCITSHYVPLDMVQSEVQIFICEVLLAKCLIYVSWSLLYLSFSLQEIQGIIRNTLSGTMRKQSYKSRSLDIPQNNWSRLLNRPKSCEERREEGVCFILKETWNP